MCSNEEERTFTMVQKSKAASWTDVKRRSPWAVLWRVGHSGTDLLQSSAAHWWTDMERRQGPDDELRLRSERRGVEVK